MLGQLLRWYARYVIAVLALVFLLIAVTWLAHHAIDWIKARRRG